MLKLNSNQKELLDRNAKLTEITQELRVKIIQAGGEPIEKPKLPEASDLLATNQILEAHYDSLVENLVTIAPSSASAIDNVERLVQDNARLREKVAELNASLEERGQQITRLNAKYADFDVAVARATAAKLIEHGVNPTAVRAAKKVTDNTETQTPGGPADAVNNTGKNWTALAQEQIAASGPPKIPIK